MVRDREWKYWRVTRDDGYSEYFHRYTEEFWTEGDNLLLETMDDEATAAYERLVAEFERWGTEVNIGP